MIFEAGMFTIAGSLFIGGISAGIMHMEKEGGKKIKKRKKLVDTTTTEFYEAQTSGKMYNIIVEDNKSGKIA